MSIIKHVTLQKIVAHDFQYDPRNIKAITQLAFISKLTKFTATLCTIRVNKPQFWKKTYDLLRGMLFGCTLHHTAFASSVLSVKPNITVPQTLENSLPSARKQPKPQVKPVQKYLSEQKNHLPEYRDKETRCVVQLSTSKKCKV